MMLHGYELTTDWKVSTSGQTAKAKKGDKRYFLKKYQTPVAPIDNGSLDAKTFAHNQALFDDFVATRKKINNVIRTIAGPGGNIIIPCDEFIEGNQFVEASEFVEGAIPDEELEKVLAGLSVDVKKLLMQTAAGALFSVHSKGIVHSDLKLKNVLLVRNASGNYVAKLIDFDNSYFLDKKPEEVIGTIDYYSPELGAYADAEDDKERIGNKLGVKSDIFSLGLIFHLYLSGDFPETVSLTESLKKRKEKGKTIYCWVALNQGCELKLSPKITQPQYVSLIQDMLRLNPEERPSASEVLKRLKELDGKKEKSKEKDSEMPKRELPSGFCSPWEGHEFEWDREVLGSRGFIAGEKAEMVGVKGYIFFRKDGSSSFLKEDMLLAMKYAKKKAESGSVSKPNQDPWPEHSIEFDLDTMKAKGYVSVNRETLGGVKGYQFVRSDGNKQFLRVEMVLLQKLAKERK